MNFKFNSKRKSKDIFKINNLPILILDESWLMLFTDDRKNEVMKLYEKGLRELLKEQARVSSEFNKFNAEKKKVLQQILELSHEAYENNSQASKNELENCKKYLDSINQKLENIEERKQNIPNEINEQNSELFQESIKVSYNIMSKNLKEVNKMEPVINSLRERLKTETEKMNNYKNDYKTYSKFLIDFIGQDGIKILDEKYNGSI